MSPLVLQQNLTLEIEIRHCLQYEAGKTFGIPIGHDKHVFKHKIVINFLSISVMLWLVLKRTVSLRRFL